MGKRTSRVFRSPELGANRALERALIWGGFLAVFLVSSATSALDRFSAADFRDEDNEAAEVLAGFPAAARNAALVVSGFPEELLVIQKLQQRSSDDFTALVAEHSREEQEQIWNLVRHPGLAADLARGGRKSTATLEEIAARYPEEDRAAIVEEGRERYPAWVRIHALDLEVESAFTSLLLRQPDSVQDAFGEVANRPDLMSLLIENMHMTAVLGAVYREDPSRVEAQFDELHNEVVARKQRDERAWAEEAADPESAEELERAAREFAQTYHYELETARSRPAARIEHHVSVHPYPFWFGYPHWYDYAYWYPRPFARHIGFTFGHGHARGHVSLGLPSPFFLHWYHGSYRPRHRKGLRDFRNGIRVARRSTRYYDTHRPLRSAKRYRPGRQLSDAHRSVRAGGRGRVGYGNLDFRRQARRVSRPEARSRRDRGHVGFLGDRAARASDRRAERSNRASQSRSPRIDRNPRRERTRGEGSARSPERRSVVERGERSIRRDRVDRGVGNREKRRVQRSNSPRREASRGIRGTRSGRSVRDAQRGRDRSWKRGFEKLKRRDRHVGAGPSAGRSDRRARVGQGRGQGGQRRGWSRSGGGKRDRRGRSGGGGHRRGGRNRN